MGYIAIQQYNMEKRILLFALTLSSLLIGCDTTKKKTDKQIEDKTAIEALDSVRDISYKIANRYFVNNTIENKQVEYLKITCQKDFDKYFGPSPVMGKNGEPTKIDFKSSFVLAIIGQVTDKETTFEVKSLQEKQNSIELKYRIKQDINERDYTIHPFEMIIVDNIYNKDTHFIIED